MWKDSQLRKCTLCVNHWRVLTHGMYVPVLLNMQALLMMAGMRALLQGSCCLASSSKCNTRRAVMREICQASGLAWVSTVTTQHVGGHMLVV